MLAGEVALVREQIQDLRPRRRLERIGPGERGPVVRGRLAMRAEACGLPRRSRREALYGVAIAGADA